MQDDQSEFTSLEAQRIACENYIAARQMDGWEIVPTHYDDPGFSGGNTNRPAFQRLMDDARNGKFEMIICYKIDRLSRRITDFTDIFRDLDKCGVKFASVTQEFNTDSSMGKMVLNLLMTFSQFERDLTSERVRDKMAATRKKGLWPGGTVPYGYMRVDKRLVPDPETAPNVKHIFELYRETGSPKEVCRRLTEEGILRFPVRKVRWNTPSLSTCLRNVVYIGKVSLGKETYPGVHEPILDIGLWNKVQKMLSEVSVKPTERRHNAMPALLQGLVHCGTCGNAMTYRWTKKASNGAKYGYYTDITDNKRAISSCPVRAVSAAILEPVVEAEVLKVLKTSFFTALVARRLNIPEIEVKEALKKPWLFWPMLPPADKRQLFKEMIKTVDIHPQSVQIEFKTGGCAELIQEIKNVNAE